MGLWPFGKKKDDRSVEALLEQANVASPTGATAAASPPPVAATGDGSFRHDRRGHLHHHGPRHRRDRPGRVRHGGSACRSTWSATVAWPRRPRSTGVEMFRKVLDSATVGDNVGLLLKGMDKAQLHAGDVLQG